jgi:hypothetical protein
MAMAIIKMLPQIEVERDILNPLSIRISARFVKNERPTAQLHDTDFRPIVPRKIHEFWGRKTTRAGVYASGVSYV